MTKTSRLPKIIGLLAPRIFYLFDKNKKLFYRGQYDGSRPGNSEEVNGEDLNQAMNLLLNNQKAPSKQIPSLGCNIKWKIDNEPDYFGI